MIQNLILSGGVAHDYARTSSVLAAVLQDVAIESTIQEDVNAIGRGMLDGFDMLTLNCVRWTCNQTPDWRGEWRFELSAEARRRMLRFLAAGKGVLALHAATICFDDWPEYGRILGAWWDWACSGHAPCQTHTMHITSAPHPITRGLRDFIIEDELYTNPRTAGDLEPLVEATWDGAAHPMLWVRHYGKGRVCYNALGHGVEAFEHPINRVLLQRGALWVIGMLNHGGDEMNTVAQPLPDDGSRSLDLDDLETYGTASS